MKKMKVVIPFFTLGMRRMLLIASLFIATSTHAGIINADFSQGADGLDSWLGDIVIDTGVSNDFNTGDITSDYPGLFSTDGAGSASISTGSVPAVGGVSDGYAYVVTLFQEFLLDPIAAGASLFLTVDFGLLAPADDFYVELYNLDTLGSEYLVSGVELDITSWVGNEVGLGFTVENLSIPDDSILQISNIQFIERQSVPEPPLFLAVLFIALILIRNPRLTK